MRKKQSFERALICPSNVPQGRGVTIAQKLSRGSAKPGYLWRRALARAEEVFVADRLVLSRRFGSTIADFESRVLRERFVDVQKFRRVLNEFDRNLIRSGSKTEFGSFNILLAMPVMAQQYPGFLTALEDYFPGAMVRFVGIRRFLSTRRTARAEAIISFLSICRAHRPWPCR